MVLSCKEKDPQAVLSDVAVNDVWIKKNDFPLAPTAQGMAFTIGSKGYVGLGSNTAKSIWEYDMVADSWTKKKDFPICKF